MKLSVIIPMYNEAESVDEFFNYLDKTLDEKKITHEIIFVDDGSTDVTLEKLKEKCMLDKDIKVISLSRNFGKEAAMLAGMKHASGEYTAIIDADMQQPPEVLVSMYEKILENKDYDVVAAYRESHKDESGLKVLLTSIFYKISNRISEIKMLPGASDFRVFNDKVKEAILSLEEKDRFLKGIFSYVGFNTLYIPYTPNKRLHGKSRWSIRKLIKYAMNGLMAFSYFPLHLVFVIGIISFLVSFLNFILLGNLSDKTIILLIGLLMLMVGIISLYVKRIYINILRRPNYIIKEKIGFDKKKK